MTGRPVFAVMIAAALSAPAAAQQAAEPPDRWAFTFEVGFNGASGNTELAVLTTALGVKRIETDAFELDWTASYRYGESEERVVARNIRSSLSFDLWPAARWSPFVFVDAERDPFLRLDIRTNAGSGVKYTFVERENSAVSLSAAVIHSYEEFGTPAGATPIDARSDARWSLRGKASHTFENGLAVENTSWFKPVFDDTGDYNIDATTKLGVKLSSSIGLNFSHTYRRDSTPPPDVETDDQVLQIGLLIEF